MRACAVGAWRQCCALLSASLATADAAAYSAAARTTRMPASPRNENGGVLKNSTHGMCGCPFGMCVSPLWVLLKEGSQNKMFLTVSLKWGVPKMGFLKWGVPNMGFPYKVGVPRNVWLSSWCPFQTYKGTQGCFSNWEPLQVGCLWVSQPTRVALL